MGLDASFSAQTKNDRGVWEYSSINLGWQDRNSELFAILGFPRNLKNLDAIEESKIYSFPREGAFSEELSRDAILLKDLIEFDWEKPIDWYGEKWQYKDIVGDFCTRIIPLLKTLGKEDEGRLVIQWNP